MTDNRTIFDLYRPWLDSNGFNKPGRVQTLDAAIASFIATGDKSVVYNAARDWMDREGYTPRRINALDAALDALRPDAGGMLGDMLQAGISVAAAVPEEGDDRYLPVFQHLASPKADPAVVKAMARSFAKHAPAYGQNKTKPRIAEFVAQISNETGGFTTFNENLNYSATRMVQVWPRYFGPGKANPQDYHRQPEKLANLVYQRAREGNTQPGDGWRYRGRGALQLTFRNNYRRFGQLLGLPLEEQPDLAADPATSVLIALEFYKQGNVNHYIDAGNFKAARGITNAGSPTYPNPHGLANVNRLRLQAMEVL